MQNTANYQLPTYEADDNANLLDGYNEAMDKVDAQLKVNADATVVAATAASNAQQTATTAATDASTALESANTAVETATTASQLATAAQGTADAAKATATQAQNTANAANTNASSAVATANKALAAVSPGNKLIIIGDSFTTDNRVNWTSMLEDYPESNLYVYAEGGAGFVTEGSSGHTFADLYAQAKSAVTGASEVNQIYAVIVYGGTNDKSGDGAACATAIRALYTQIRTDFPNARPLMCLFNAGLLNQDRYDYYADFIDDCAGALGAGSSTGGTPFVNTLYWLWGCGSGNYENDLLHPNAGGMRYIAQHMTALLRGEPLDLQPRIRSWSGDYGYLTLEFTPDGGMQWRGMLDDIELTSDTTITTINNFPGGKFKHGQAQNIPIPFTSASDKVYALYVNSSSGAVHCRSTASSGTANIYVYG